MIIGKCQQEAGALFCFLYSLMVLGRKGSIQKKTKPKLKREALGVLWVYSTLCFSSNEILKFYHFHLTIFSTPSWIKIQLYFSNKIFNLWLLWTSTAWINIYFLNWRPTRLIEINNLIIEKVFMFQLNKKLLESCCCIFRIWGLQRRLKKTQACLRQWVIVFMVFS